MLTLNLQAKETHQRLKERKVHANSEIACKRVTGRGFTDPQSQTTFGASFLGLACIIIAAGKAMMLTTYTV